MRKGGSVGGVGCGSRKQVGLVADLGMAFVDDWVMGNEKGRYWLSDDIVGLVGSLAMLEWQPQH